MVSEWKQRKTADLSANPFQLQNALHSALKLRFFDGLGLRWAADPGNSHRGRCPLPAADAPASRTRKRSLRFPISAMLNPAQRARDSNPPNPIFASRRYTVFAYSSRIFLREPVSIAERFALCSETTFFLMGWGYVGLPIRETRIVAPALLAISDFRHAESRTAGAWLQSLKPA